MYDNATNQMSYVWSLSKLQGRDAAFSTLRGVNKIDFAFAPAAAVVLLKGINV
jgi:hypothetical protein